MPLRTRIADERGMTIVEVMAAMVVLVIGVMGTLTLVQGSLSSTSATTAREQATNLARDLVERSRQAAYADITYTNAAATLRSMLPASDSVSALSGPTNSQFTVQRRGTTYTVNVLACSIDDPTDGVGQTPTHCAVPEDPPPVNTTTPGLAASVNVLGISVTAGGSLLETVCNAVGTPAILSQLTGAISSVASVSVCPTGAGSATVAYDETPEDLRRVRVDVSWNRERPGAISQTTLLTNPTQS